MNQCDRLKCPWYYRARGAWCPTHKKLYEPGTIEYLELTTRETAYEQSQ